MRSIVFFFLMIPMMSLSQSLEMGLRDSRYVHGVFIGEKGWSIGYEQSLLNVKACEQNGCILSGYSLANNYTQMFCIAYYRFDYSKSWSALGLHLGSRFNIKRLSMELQLNPNKDTDLDFRFCYKIAGAFSVYKSCKNISYACPINEHVDLSISWSNIPEYRVDNKSMRIGIMFVNNNLWVHPEICIPNIEKKIDKIRVLCSMGWNLRFQN